MKIIKLLILLLPLFCLSQEEKIKQLDINLTNYEYPFPVNFLELNNQRQSLKMAYMDIKPDNYNNKNIILLHGKNFNGAYWENTIKALTKEGFRVIVPDQIGFGKSSKPDNFQYTFQQLAENTKKLLDHLEIKKTAVLGHSMGGMLASRFALMYPESTEKLILENPIGLEDWKLVVPYKPVEWWYESELKQNYEAIKKYQMENYYDGKWNADFQKWAELGAGWTSAADYNKVAWNSALLYDMIFTQPVLYEFKNIKSPTLLIIGTRDKTALGKPLVSDEVKKKMGNYEALGKKTQSAIPNSKLAEIPNTGHLPHIESFYHFIKPLIEFLKQ
ncbi:alpha/beta fold hydrolase [Flavobacterium reichenbachii]|uniref:Alpha/beta hydrolase n=1 Tax=Flavobacterium reichenbachii TaxID=362418 RepID=A0A085ZMW0_9FLAO|nr:alpha/beta hydrolase [Flavobacterium reichenbachii]KFF05774.1 alpha/beta hydrolase [Flavobacterium reichenbachii]OXB12663.1 alpha/beta hydrolase [Flavobacterium reichenbachii]